MRKASVAALSLIGMLLIATTVILYSEVPEIRGGLRGDAGPG